MEENFEQKLNLLKCDCLNCMSPCDKPYKNHIFTTKNESKSVLKYKNFFEMMQMHHENKEG